MPEQGTETTFTVEGTRVAGLHVPGRGGDLATAAGRPCVVMAHGFGGTVDTGLEPFARELAEAGTDVLAFDYRGFGRSGGEPRQVLSIPGQRADYHAAIAHARSLEGVDPERIVLWGVSYSGGHVLQVAAEDQRIAAVIALTPATDGRVTMKEGLRDSSARRAMPRVMARAVRDRLAARRGEAPVTVPLTAPPGGLGVLTAPGVHEAYTAMAGPTWRNEVAARILLEAGSYRPVLYADQFAAPLLIQVADQDQTASPSAALAAARSGAEVRHYPCDHFDVHVGGAWHGPACEDQIRFLRRHLGAADGDAPQATDRRAAGEGDRDGAGAGDRDGAEGATGSTARS